MGKNGGNRAGDTSQRCGNSPAVFVSSDFTPPMVQPVVLGKAELLESFAEMGFKDTRTPQASNFIDRVGYSHARPYAKAFAHKGLGLAAVEKAIRFDREFQAILLKYIGMFEVQFRAQYSRMLADVAGPFAHRDPTQFKNVAQHAKSIEKYVGEANKRVRQKDGHARAMIAEYGDLPVWDAVEAMTMGTLSMLYKNTRSKAVRFGVADSFGVRYEELASWMSAISFVRNRCAHFGRLAGTSLVIAPKAISGVNLSTSHPLYSVLVLERLLSSEVEFRGDLPPLHSMALVAEINDLAAEYDGPVARAYLPPSWQSLITRPDIMRANASASS